MQTATTKQNRAGNAREITLEKPLQAAFKHLGDFHDTAKSIPQMEREEALRQSLLLNLAFQNKNPQAATA